MKANCPHLNQGHRGRPHWVGERVSAILLMPISLWVSVFALRLAGRSRQEMVRHLARPGGALPIMIMMCLVARHMQLGLDVIIGDYIRGAVKKLARGAVRVFCLGLVASVAISLLKIRRQQTGAGE